MIINKATDIRVSHRAFVADNDDTAFGNLNVNSDLGADSIMQHW